MHAIALARVRAITERHHPEARAAVDEAVSDLYPRVAAWHRWLHTERDPGRTGLVTIFHPWESGLDNSPRWDAALAAVAILEETSGERPDLAHVADASERPTDDDYRRYHTLVRELVDVDYDQGRAHRTHPFRMADVLFTAILAAADDALADLAEIAGRPEAAEGHRADAEHGRRGLDACWDPAQGACLDRDLIADRWITADTIAGFAPLVAGCGARPRRRARPPADRAVVRGGTLAAVGGPAVDRDRRPGVRPPVVLARSELAGHHLAAVVGVGAGRPPRPGRCDPQRGGRPAAGLGMQRVRGGPHRRAAGIERPVVDGSGHARLARPRKWQAGAAVSRRDPAADRGPHGAPQGRRTNAIHRLAPVTPATAAPRPPHRLGSPRHRALA